MAARKNGKGQLQEFLRAQLADAQKRFTQLEGEAQRILENLADRARQSHLADVQKRFIHVQRRVVEGVGVASQGQIQQLTREMAKLSKKVDALVGRKANRTGLQN